MEKENRLFIKRYSNIHDIDKYMIEAIPEHIRARFIEYRRNWAKTSEMNELTDFPLEIAFDVLDGCNLSCDICTRSHNRGTMKKLDLNLYKAIIDEVSKHSLASITYGMEGEPTLNPNLTEMIRYATLKGAMDIRVGTNGQNLTPEETVQLVKA
ncbi:MAG: radical SAM protein, partial [Nitrospirae bacterium]|nr:radical SAM protein [Nitrospirota bacterium]